jgi:hypothetical protein
MGASQSQQQIHPLPLAPMLAISDDDCQMMDRIFVTMNAQKGCGNVSPSTSLFGRFGSANKL